MTNKKKEPRYEVLPDGVREIPEDEETCDFCEESCENDWCPTKDEDEN